MLWIFKRVKNAWSRKDFEGRSKSSALSFSLSPPPIQQLLEYHGRIIPKWFWLKVRLVRREKPYFFQLSLKPVPCKPMKLTEGSFSPHQLSTRIPQNLPVISYFWFWFKTTNLPIDGQIQYVLQFQIYFQTFKSLTSSDELKEIQNESWCPVLFFLWHIQVIVKSSTSGWSLDHSGRRHSHFFWFKLRIRHTSTLISHVLVSASPELCLFCSD